MEIFMEKKIDINAKRLRIAKILLSVLIAVTGIAFIVGCAVLYFTGGDKPYSRERVGDFLLWFTALPSLATVAAAIVAHILGLKVGEKQNSGEIMHADTLKRMNARLVLEECSAESQAKIRYERKRRRFITAAMIGISVVTAAIGFIYMTIIAEYAEGASFSNLDVIRVLLVVLPMGAIMLGLWWMAMIDNGRSIVRELDTVLAEMQASKSVVKKPEKQAQKAAALDGTAGVVVRAVLFAVAIAFVAVGIMNGGMMDVLAKAVKICTECIGLG